MAPLLILASLLSLQAHAAFEGVLKFGCNFHEKSNPANLKACGETLSSHFKSDPYLCGVGAPKCVVSSTYTDAYGVEKDYIECAAPSENCDMPRIGSCLKGVPDWRVARDDDRGDKQPYRYVLICRGS